ncbi:hypothetical protein V8C35DRAFT_314920 [Trichoderma chlorosporum]
MSMIRTSTSSCLFFLLSRIPAHGSVYYLPYLVAMPRWDFGPCRTKCPRRQGTKMDENTCPCRILCPHPWILHWVCLLR